MNKKIFLAFLLFGCFLLGARDVCAKEGWNERGESVQICEYANEKASTDRLIIVVNTKQEAAPLMFISGTNLVDFKVKLFGNDDIWYNTSLPKNGDYYDCTSYLYNFILHLYLPTEAFDYNKNYYHMTFNDQSREDGIIKKVMEDEEILLWTVEKIYESRYKVEYSYGVDNINFNDTDSLAKKIVEIFPDSNKPGIKYNGGNEGCAVLTEPVKEKINWVLDFIKYGGAILAILLGALDFLKATLSDEDNASKKAFEKFIKRLIAAILIFLLPLLIEFLFTAVNPVIKIEGFNKDAPTCGIGVSK